MPRPYQQGQRKAMSFQTRARILEAARALLLRTDGAAAFSVEAVARQADVARMTVYYQFGSRAGLLEALFDDLAARGGLDQLPGAFQQQLAEDALDAFVVAFCRFWASDPLVLRRLRGLAVLDPDLEEALRARDERRRTGLNVIARRLTAQAGRPAPAAHDAVVAILHTLTGFATFESLAAALPGADIGAIIRQLAHAALACNAAPASDH